MLYAERALRSLVIATQILKRIFITRALSTLKWIIFFDVQQVFHVPVVAERAPPRGALIWFSVPNKHPGVYLQQKFQPQDMN